MRQPNREDVNAAAQLLMRRVVARHVPNDPQVLERARARIASLDGQVPDWVFARCAMARKITEGWEEMERLRSASPFDLPELKDLAVPRRIWSKARRRLGIPPGQPRRGQALR
jgi:hypothetical protein